MSIRAMIVDDEPLARERIRSLLEGESDIDVIAECANGRDAVQVILERRPDLVFLDIQMPGLNGFDVLDRIAAIEHPPQVIFVTAYDQHAIKAFEVNAADYLLKPFKPVRLKQSLERVRKVLATNNGPNISRELLEALKRAAPAREYLSRIAVRNDERVVFVKTQSLDFVESAGNYVLLHCGKETHILRETLSTLEEQLDPKKFLRISRSTLVNIDQVKELQPLFKGEHVVVLHNGKQLPMTRGVREVQEFLKFT